MKITDLYIGKDPQRLKEDFVTHGFCLARGLYADQVEAMHEHFVGIHADGGVSGYYEPMSEAEAGGDSLKVYPRVMHPHRFSEKARDWMVDSRVSRVLAALFEEEALAVQSMYYFKPPGAAGQSLHQDQFYLKVQPGTCIAAWTALDYCDVANGGMMVVPYTHEDAIDCSKVGKGNSYEGGASIPIPDGKKAVLAEMEPGDTLFFNGSLIHGSGPNRTTDRWRRSFICHYVGASTQAIGGIYQPLISMAGESLTVEATQGGPCGVADQKHLVPH